jgi:hypothetical protein
MQTSSMDFRFLGIVATWVNSPGLDHTVGSVDGCAHGACRVGKAVGRSQPKQLMNERPASADISE